MLTIGMVMPHRRGDLAQRSGHVQETLREVVIFIERPVNFLLAR
jgi:hypothetical protein